MSRTSSSPPKSSAKLRHFQASSVIFLFLLSFRLLNALTLRTFFQPDEYFQSLEPAWQLVFGEGWITWEWRNRLRSFAHPSIFALLYASIDRSSSLLSLSAETTSEWLAVAPRLLQAVFAALGDYYTARLAGKISGAEEGWTALWLSIGSAFHWFCATRTFSNSLETSITTIALYYWPWEWSQGRKASSSSSGRGSCSRLRMSLLLAAVACFLRPTNVLIWACIGLVSLFHATPAKRFDLAANAVAVGLGVFALNTMLDRVYYRAWAFPPVNFLKFNLVESLSVFYGRNPWHYYLSQGIPLLLTSYLPLCLLALYRVLRTGSSESAHWQLAATATTVTAIYSAIAHKEVRFLYPLLPIFHVLGATALHALPWGRKARTRALLAMLALNAPIAYYAGSMHQRGVVDVVAWLRGTKGEWADVGFLMPCHSTPWRSSLGLGAGEMRALSCEPPVGLGAEDRESYLDEADEFYAGVPEGRMERWLGADAEWGWPDRIVFFGALEEAVEGFLGRQEENVRYRECKRLWNSHVHDDSRRRGDVVVLCKQPVRTPEPHPASEL